MVESGRWGDAFLGFFFELARLLHAVDWVGMARHNSLPARQTIEQLRLADVGEPHNGDLRQELRWNGSISSSAFLAFAITAQVPPASREIIVAQPTEMKTLNATGMVEFVKCWWTRVSVPLPWSEVQNEWIFQQRENKIIRKIFNTCGGCHKWGYVDADF